MTVIQLKERLLLDFVATCIVTEKSVMTCYIGLFQGSATILKSGTQHFAASHFLTFHTVIVLYTCVSFSRAKLSSTGAFNCTLPEIYVEFHLFD